MNNTLQAGLAQVDITPPLGTLINGDFVTHYATQVHSRLYAKAMVLNDGLATIAICIVDICAMRRTLIDEMKQLVFKQTGIAPQNVLIASTHTHAGGSVESLLLGAADLPYRQKLPTLIAEAVAQAKSNLTPATIGYGSADAPEYVLCRRYKMKDGYLPMNPVTGQPDQVKTNPFGAEDQIIGPVAAMDTQLSFMGIKNLQGEWLGLLGNYSMHYVGDWPNGTLSADYFGEFADQLKTKLGAGDDFIAMLTNGTSGEANIWDFLNSNRFPTAYFEKSKLIGGALASKVAQRVEAMEWQTDTSVATQYADVTVALRKPNTEELANAEQLVAASTYEHLEGIDFATMQKLYAREQVLLNDWPEEISFPVQALKIGNVVIGGLGGEFFAETGLSLKDQAKKYHYFTITLANDYVGYVCPEHEITRGGYETWRCRTSCLEVKAEHQLKNKLIELIRNF